jgi:stress response protein SCP2
MKEHLRDIRKKYETALIDKGTAVDKYTDVLAQNEELTLLIASLKHDLQMTTRTQSSWAIEEQLAHLREDMKQLELQREASEERASNFERRMNEYIAKHNELQNIYGQSQVKYYKLQKDNDNLRVDKEELTQKVNTLTTQLQAERTIHMQEVDKLRGRVREESAREDVLRSQLFEQQAETKEI